MTERPPKRPPVLEGETTVKKTKCGNIYVTVNHNEQGELDEVLLVSGNRPDDGDKKIYLNCCTLHLFEWMGKMVTNHIRNKLELKRIIKQAKSTTECYPGICKYPDSKSCAHAVASALEQYVKAGDRI